MKTESEELESVKAQIHIGAPEKFDPVDVLCWFGVPEAEAKRIAAGMEQGK